jgi:uncharacterized protein
LLLRGPQTPGELRTRASRIHPFEDLESVHSALQRLSKREPPLVTALPRQPGTKETRYAHLMAEGDPLAEAARESSQGQGVALRDAHAAHGTAQEDGQLAALVDEVARLRAEVAALQEQFAAFRKQFE